MFREKELLAEFVGIMFGDGCFYKGKRCYHISVSCNKKEVQYLNHIITLMHRLFPGEYVTVYEIKSEFLIRSYSRKIANTLFSLGVNSGNKTKRIILIPTWIKEDRSCLIAFLRGLFDTDGCVYRKYGNYIQIQMKLANKDLVDDIRDSVLRLGFTPTKVILDFEKVYKSYEWKFYLSRQAEIHKFIKLIKLRNSKHITRYANFVGP